MDVVVENNSLSFSGILNENMNVNKIKNEVMAIKSKIQKQERIRVDFGKVTHANSCGILQWLNIIGESKAPFTYYNVPIWFVEQFNMLEEIFFADVLVESIYAPFYIPSKEITVFKLLTLGTDIPFLDEYSDINFTFSKDGVVHEPDFDPDDYFLFIKENKSKLERILQK